ncbi:hypothetical protein [Azospirillum sp. sgz302134]
MQALAAVKDATVAGQLSDIAWASLMLAKAHSAGGEHQEAAASLETAESLARRLSLKTLLSQIAEFRSDLAVPVQS